VARSCKVTFSLPIWFPPLTQPDFSPGCLLLEASKRLHRSLMPSFQALEEAMGSCQSASPHTWSLPITTQSSQSPPSSVVTSAKSQVDVCTLGTWTLLCCPLRAAWTVLLGLLPPDILHTGKPGLAPYNFCSNLLGFLSTCEHEDSYGAFSCHHRARACVVTRV
jgi:hypothetical protein